MKRFTILAMLIALTAWCVVSAATPAMAQDDANTATDPNAAADELPADEGPKTLGEKLNDAWLTFQAKWAVGGYTMWALAFLAAIALVFVVDRIVMLRRGRIVPHKLADRANALWQQGQYEQIVQLARRSRSTLGKIIAFMVEHRENNFEHINTVAGEIGERDFAVHARRNYPLAAVGTLSPLLGLMGTVFGLMGAFATIGVVGTMDDPASLAGDIGKALVTTAGGLILAVPALGLYHYFKSRTGVLANILGEEVSNLQNAWFLKKGGSDADQK
ncbi:MAG: MotA/TolQ/ExbB proton channel family protein [Phycisphaerae bacterium]